MLNGGLFSVRGRLLAPVALVALALFLSACGSSEEGPAANVRQNSLVGQASLERQEQGSVERTFLEYWSNLQFNSWADVVAYYDPEFRDYIGTATLIAAKKTGASVYPYLQPEIKETKTEDGLTTVYYTLSMEDGTTELASTSWRRSDGNWELIFDSRLDGELSAFAQERVALGEEGGEGLATELPPSAKALRAGRSAARLQAEFLEDALNGGGENQ
ncbi:MAG: hypothetical protein WA862_05040 [Solirubrobacterales bacterium]